MKGPPKRTQRQRRDLVLVDPRHVANIFMRLCDAAAASRNHMMTVAAALDVLIEEVKAQRAVVREVRAQQRAKPRRAKR